MERRPVGGSTAYDWIAPSTPAGVTDAAWVTLTGSYTFADPVEVLNLYVESDSVDAEYYIDDIIIVMTSLPPTEPPPPIQDIDSVYEFHVGQFRIGAAIEPDQLDSPRHVELLLKHFNNITAQNAMKPGPIQPTEGNFNWDPADKLADFARDNDIEIY